ncbi:unnamed protein product [Chilo suppressalis]|uniref:MD-2-related lipid-recognition domain-containing protein n=1 Tax=Chilo suppressalis TaxID=168631 RepID=A0ABN8AYZ9_CHISP|nr:unnamed protein product [Chilo suppressalis]
MCDNSEKKNWARIKLEICNPKYFLNCSITTFEAKHQNGDGGRILINMTLTALVPGTNNLSIGGTVEYKSKFRVNYHYKFCDFLKLPWVVAILETQNVPHPLPCPYPAGTFSVHNVEMPPAKWPLLLKSTKYRIYLEVNETSTKERAIAITLQGEMFKPNKRND